MKIISVEPYKFIHQPNKFPDNPYKHFVFAGRSNVGKSSLINCLLNRKLVAKVSKTPGKTISVNFYLVNNKFFIVDLPGFGFALNRKKKKGTWDDLINRYFMEFPDNITLFHLVDSRIGPTKLDFQMEEYCEQFDFSRNIIITKIDKLRKNEIKKASAGVAESLRDFNIENILIFSSKNKTGRKEVLRSISEKISK